MFVTQAVADLGAEGSAASLFPNMGAVAISRSMAVRRRYMFVPRCSISLPLLKILDPPLNTRLFLGVQVTLVAYMQHGGNFLVNQRVSDRKAHGNVRCYWGFDPVPFEKHKKHMHVVALKSSFAWPIISGYQFAIKMLLLQCI